MSLPRSALPPWDYYDEHTVPDILDAIDNTTCTDEQTVAVRDYEAANQRRAAILSRCAYQLATVKEPGSPKKCGACGLRPAAWVSRDSDAAICEACDTIEDRRTELRREFHTDPGVRRCEEIQRELDGLNVEQYQLEPGDFVDEAGRITRADDEVSV